MGGKKIPWLLNVILGGGLGEGPAIVDDQFLTDDAAPLTSPRDSEPGPGNLEVYKDTTNALSISSGELVINGAVAADDPRFLFNPSVARQLGRIGKFKFKVIALVAGYTKIGWAASPKSALDMDSGFLLTTAEELKIIPITGTVTEAIFTLVAGTWYEVALILRSTGLFTFVKGGIFTEWTLVYPAEGSNVSPVYLTAFQAITREVHIDNVRIPQQLWWPRPFLSDGFGSNPSTFKDESDLNLEGTFHETGLGGPKGTYHSNGYIELDLTELDTVFQAEECTVIQLIQVQDWDPGAAGASFTYYVGVTGHIYLRHDGTAGQFEWRFRSSTGTFFRTKTGLSTLSEWVAGLTVSVLSAEAKAFYDGVKEGATMVPSGTTGSPTLRMLVGAQDTGPVWPFPGWIKDTILGLNGTVISEADMATVTTHLKARTLTTAILDSIFGSGNWAWWNHRDQVMISDGQAHQEADGGVTIYEGSPMYLDSGVLKNDPPAGADLLTNGDFSAWTGDDPDSWTVVGETAPDPEITERDAAQAHGGAGNGAANFYSTVGGGLELTQAGVLTLNKWYKVTFEVTAWVVGRLRIDLGGIESRTPSGTGVKEFIYYAAGTGLNLENVASCDLTVDWAKCQEVAIEDLVDVADHGVADVVADVLIPTNLDNYCQGLALCVDDPDNVQNGVFIYLAEDVFGTGYSGSGTDLVVLKMVGGVLTLVASNGVTYGAAKVLRVDKFGDQWNVYYDDVLEHNLTINDAGIVDNTFHGVFHTGGGTIDDLVIWKKKGWNVVGEL